MCDRLRAEGRWEAAANSEESMKLLLDKLKSGWRRDEQFLELRLYRLARQTVAWNREDTGYSLEGDLAFLAEGTLSKDTWGTYVSFKALWGRAWNAKELEKHLPRIDEIDAEITEDELSNRDHTDSVHHLQQKLEQSQKQHEEVLAGLREEIIEISDKSEIAPKLNQLSERLFTLESAIADRTSDNRQRFTDLMERLDRTLSRPTTSSAVSQRVEVGVTSRPRQAEVAFSKLLVLYSLAILFQIWSGFLLSRLWEWFVVPLGVRPLSLAHAIGVALLVGLFLPWRYRDEALPEGGIWALVFSSWCGSLLILGLGYFLRGYM